MLSSKYDISNLFLWIRHFSRHRLLIYMRRVSKVGDLRRVTADSQPLAILPPFSS